MTPTLPEIVSPELAAKPACARVPLTYFTHGASERTLLRFSTAGSVDDGKSTLIGRLLVETKGAFDDQIEAVRASKVNRSGRELDFSLLTDGLTAEREQGITIDVAYRYFSTPRRKFIVADTPGHEQYTRNMATGASTADVAVILIDARKGVLEQSRRHAYISALLGIRHLAIAINKMDLVDCSRAVYDQVERDFRAMSLHLRGAHLHFIPVSALDGDNVVERSTRMPWYTGPTLLEFLENVEIDQAASAAFRFPVQLVIRPHLDFRGFAGQVASGRVRVGDQVTILPSARTTTIERIVTFDGDLEEAIAPMSVTLVLADEVDVSRGNLIVHTGDESAVTREFSAMMVWMSAEPLEVGHTYLLRHGPHQVQARVVGIDHRVDVTNYTSHAADTLHLNDIARVRVETAQPLHCDLYQQNRHTGAFILLDPLSNLTLGAGMIEEMTAIRRTGGTRELFRSGPVTLSERITAHGHRPAWIVHDNHAVAVQLERRLFERGIHVVRVDRPVPELLDAGYVVISNSRLDGHQCATVILIDVDEAIRELETLGVIPRQVVQDEGEGI
jgi:sulfate adenylyltransferase subunit 1